MEQFQTNESPDELRDDEACEGQMSLRDQFADQQRQLDALNLLSRELSQDNPLPLVFAQALPLIGRAMNAEACRVLERLPNGNYELTAESGWFCRSEEPGESGEALPDAYAALARYTLSLNQTALVRQLQTESRFTPGRDYQHLTTAIATLIPITIEKQYGVLEVGRKASQTRDCAEDSIRFTGGQAAFLESAAQLLGAIIAKRRSGTNRQNQDDRFRFLLGAVHEGIWNWDIKHGVIHWNDQLFEMLGLDTRPQLDEESVRALLHEDDIAHCRDVLEQHFTTGKSYQLEFRIRHASGRYLTVLSRGQAIYGPDGKPVRMLGLVSNVSEMRNADYLAEESENRFRKLADAVPVLIQMSDENNNPQFYNRACQNFSGKTMAYLIEHTWMRTIVHPEDREQAIETYKKAVERHVRFQVEYRAKRVDGQLRYIMQTGIPRFTSDGEFIGYVSMGIDITEQREYATRFRRVVESNLLGIMFWQADGQVTDCNDAYLQNFGYTRDDLEQGRINWQRMGLPENRFVDNRIWAELAETGVSKVYEKRYTRPDGNVVDLMVGVATLKEGELDRGLAFSLDVTEQKNTMARYRRIVDSNIIGVCYSRLNGEIVEGNDAFLEIIGYSRQVLEAGQLNWWSLMPEEYKSATDTALKEMSATGSSQPYEKQLFHAQGHRVDVQLSIATLPENPDMIITVIRDVTERVSAQRALEATLTRERMSRRILEISNRIHEPERMLDAYAAEIGRSLGTDRCAVFRIWPSVDNPGFCRFGFASQYLASPDIGPLTESVFPPRLRQIIFEKMALDPFLTTLVADDIKIFCDQLIGILTPEARDEAELAEWRHIVRDVFTQKYGVQSYVRIGIFHKGQPMGVIVLNQCNYSREWKPEEIDLLKSIAHYIGSAIYQAELLERETRARAALERSVQLIDIINEAQTHFINDEDDQRLFQDLLSRLLDFSGSQVGVIGEVLISPEGMPRLKTSYVTGVGWSDEARREAAECMELADLHTLFGQVMITAQPVIRNDLKNDPLHWDRRRVSGWALVDTGMETFMGLPLMKGTELVGVVGIANRPGGYTQAMASELQPYLAACANIIEGLRAEERQANLTRELSLSERALKTYTRKLEQSNNELEQFATAASHDLQAPLRKVTLFSGYLATSLGADLSEETRDYLTRIQRSVTKMQQLINDLLLLSRVTRRGKPFMPVDLNEVMMEVRLELEPQLRETNGEIQVKPLMIIDADSTQMYQLFQNLIGNALKFHKKGVPPKVTVESHMLPGDLCQITVRDNGIGFDEKYVERVFSVFERLHGETAYEGTGIGLAIVKKIAERHRGTVTARSVPNEGSLFIINLPAYQP